MTGKQKLTALLLAVLMTAMLAACTGKGDADAGSGSSTLTVFAAASVKSSFAELAERFEAENPGTTVTLSFAGSADLATQLSQGAPADVFASADSGTMAKVQEAGLVDGRPRNFASNTLAIAVPPGTRQASAPSRTWPKPVSNSWPVPRKCPAGRLPPGWRTVPVPCSARSARKTP